MWRTMGDSIPRRLLVHAKTRPLATAYATRGDDHWRETSWRTFVEEVRMAARGLLALGVAKGDRVCILGFNRPEWTILDHAAMMIGAVPAGIYTTCSSDEVHYILEHSEAKVVLVENAAQLAKVSPRLASLPSLLALVTMQDVGPADGPARPDQPSEGASAAPTTAARLLRWSQLMALGQEVEEPTLDARLDSIEPSDLATLIYTSGTTGPPKAVMLSHHNLCWTATQLVASSEVTDADCLLSYLPLSHIAEQMGTIHVPATAGCAVYYAESIERVADNLKQARPTIFFGVPRIWEKLHAALSDRLHALTGGKKHLVARARKVCLEVHRRRGAGKPCGPWLTLQYRLFTRLVTDKIKAAIGFDRTRSSATGAAPIALEVLELFASLDLPIYEVYGQSEGSGPTTFNVPGQCKLGTVGRPMPGLTVKLDEDGEVLVSGPNIFLGYLKDRQATAETLVEGWLRSGDLGAFDADGYLSITGRKKEIIITSGGKNISPRNLEDALRESRLIADAVVIGDRRKFLSALLVLDEQEASATRERARAAGTPEDQALHQAAQRAVDEVNARTAQVARIKRFTLLPQAFSIEGGELTPTLKLKRSVVANKYGPLIEAMYSDDAS